MDSITSVQNDKIKEAAKLVNSAAYRKKKGLFILEGLRLCADVHRSGLRAETLFVTEKAFDKYREELTPLLEVSEKSYIITEAVSEKISDTKNSQGIFLLMHTLPVPEEEVFPEKGKILLLENVQDPGNLGAISRTAEALGITELIVSGGCDIYNPKALRASMGALLRLSVRETGCIEDTIKKAENSGYRTYASTPSEDAVKITDADFTGNVLCVIGNEARGITAETLHLCNNSITIPMTGRAESLNAGAAASILMWEMVKADEKNKLLDLAQKGSGTECGCKKDS